MCSVRHNVRLVKVGRVLTFYSTFGIPRAPLQAKFCVFEVDILVLDEV